jgi:hypothetical protein
MFFKKEWKNVPEEPVREAQTELQMLDGAMRERGKGIPDWQNMGSLVSGFDPQGCDH